MIGAGVKVRRSPADVEPVAIGEPEVQNDERRPLGRGGIQPCRRGRGLYDAIGKLGECVAHDAPDLVFVIDDEHHVVRGDIEMLEQAWKALRECRASQAATARLRMRRVR